MGRVWLGYDEVLHRDVAVKEVVPPPGLTAEERDMSSTRSLREARAIARLNHPGVVRIYDVVNKEPWPWIVMEYVPSRSLHQVIAEDGPLPPAEVAQIGLAVLAALCAAHRAGVVHRDVKPSNVLLSGKRVVLTDWGLATVEGDATVTRSGMIIGSPAYIAPERARDGTSGPASDLWSLGATLYAAVEGHSPYERSSAIATLTALATEEPDPPRHAGRLRPVLNGLLRKDPNHRISPKEAERLLRKAVGRVKPAPAPLWLSPRRRPSDANAPTATVIPVSPAPVEQPPPRTGIPDAETAVVSPARSEWGRWAALAGIVVALLLVAIGVLLTNRTPAHRTPHAPAAATTTAAASAPAPSTEAPSTQGPSQESGLASAAAPVLPGGWHMYRDATGFSVPVPDGWSKFVRDGIVYFQDPVGHRLLGIDQTDQPKMDPVKDWQSQEAIRVRRGDFPGYELIGIRHVDYHVTAADWEFRYNSGGLRLHVINRGAVFNNHQAYGFYWSTPDSQWNANLGNFELITRLFQGKP
jgi:serine/threonine protein kinase